MEHQQILEQLVLNKEEIYKHLEIISKSLFNNLVFVGGISKYMQGYKETFKDIDISITIEYVDKIKELGIYAPIEYETIFQYPIIDQFVVLYNDDYFLDVFVRDGIPNYVVIDGIKYSTIEDDIWWFKQQNQNEKYIQDKLHNSFQLLKEYEKTKIT